MLMSKKKAVKLTAPCGKSYVKNANLQKHIPDCKKCQEVILKRLKRKEAKKRAIDKKAALEKESKETSTVENTPSSEIMTEEPDKPLPPPEPVQAPPPLPSQTVDVGKLKRINLKNINVKGKSPYQDTFSEKSKAMKKALGVAPSAAQGATPTGTPIPVVDPLLATGQELTVAPTEAQKTAKVLVCALDGVFVGMERWASAEDVDKLPLTLSSLEKTSLSYAVAAYLETLGENPITPEMALGLALLGIVIPSCKIFSRI